MIKRLLLCLLCCASGGLQAQIGAASRLTTPPGQAQAVRTRLGGIDAATGRCSFSLPLGPRLPGRIPAGFVLTFDNGMGAGTFRPVVWRLGNAVQPPNQAVSNTVTLFGQDLVFHTPAAGVAMPSDSVLQGWMTDRHVDSVVTGGQDAVKTLQAGLYNKPHTGPVATLVHDLAQASSDGTQFLVVNHWHLEYSLTVIDHKTGTITSQPMVVDLPADCTVIDGDLAIAQKDLVTTLTNRWGDKVTLTESGSDGTSGTFVLQDAVSSSYQLTLTVTATPPASAPGSGAATLAVSGTLGGVTPPSVSVQGLYAPATPVAGLAGTATWLGAFTPTASTETASDGTSRTITFDANAQTVTYPDGLVEHFLPWKGPSWVDSSWNATTGQWGGASYAGVSFQPTNVGCGGVDRTLPDGTGQSVVIQPTIPTGHLVYANDTAYWIWDKIDHVTAIYTFPKPTGGTAFSNLPFRLTRLTHVAMPTSNPLSPASFLACTSAVVQEEHLHGEDGAALQNTVTDEVLRFSEWDLSTWANPQGTPGPATTAAALLTQAYRAGLPTQTTLVGDAHQGGRDAYGPVRTDVLVSAPTGLPGLLSGEEAVLWNATSPASSLAGPNLRTGILTRTFHPVAAQLKTLTEHRTLDSTDFGTTTYQYGDTTGLLTATSWKRGGYTRTTSRDNQILPATVTHTLAGPDILAGSGSGDQYAYGPAPCFAVTQDTDQIDGRPVKYTTDDLGRITQKTDGLGLVTTQTYDAWGRPWVETRQSGTGQAVTTTRTYDVNGTWKDVTVSAAGLRTLTTRTTLDGFGHPVKVVTSDDKGTAVATQTFSYDGFGQLHQQSPVLTGAQGSWGSETWNYDTRGRLFEHLDARGRLLSRVTQQPTWATEPVTGTLGIVSTVLGAAVATPTGDQSFARTEVKDLLGRTQAALDPNQQVTTYAYDGDGNLTQTTQGQQHRAYAHNAVGFLVSRDEPEEGQTQYGAFTITGVPTTANRTGLSQQSAAGTTVTLNSHLLPTDVATTGPGGPCSRHLDYDSDHFPYQLTDTQPNGTLTETYGHDEVFRLNHKAVSDGLHSFEVDRQLNPLGQVTSLTYPSGGGKARQTVGTSFDAQNRPLLITLDSALRAQLNADQVDGTSVTSVIQFANLAMSSYLRTMGELVNVTHQVTSGLPGNLSENLSWTAGGLLRARGADTFCYDPLLRLVQSTTAGLAPGESLAQGFGYDQYGNRTSSSFSYASGSGGVQPGEVMGWTATYGARNQLPAAVAGAAGSLPTGAAYDDFGRLTAVLAVPNSQGQFATSWGYDAAGRVVAETVGGVASSFLLDGEGLRFKRMAGDGSAVYTVYGFNREPLAVFNLSALIVTQAQAHSAKASLAAPKGKQALAVTALTADGPMPTLTITPAGGSLTIPVGGSLTLQGTSSQSGSALSWVVSDGATGSGASLTHAFSTAGSYTVSLKTLYPGAPVCSIWGPVNPDTGERACKRSSIPMLTATTSVTVTVVAPPTVTSFTASPATITQGDSTTLSWSVTGATSFKLDPGIGGVGGNTSVQNPSGTTTYTLTATNTVNGVSVSSTAQVTVVVNPQPTVPTIQAFAADTPTLFLGGGTVLRWTVSSAVGSAIVTLGSASVSTSGSQAVSGLTTTTTYVLTAVNAQDTSKVVRQQLTLTVIPAPVITLTGPSNLNSGSQGTLKWDVSNNPDSVTVDPGVGAVGASGSVVIAPTATTTYTVTARNGSGTVVKTFLVNVTPKPVLSAFASSAASISLGQSVTLTWAVQGADGLVLNGTAVTGTSWSVTPSTTTTYLLSATNAAGTDSAAVTVTVTIPPSLSWTRSLVHGFGQLLSEETPGGTTYLQTDLVGSPTILTDAQGNVVGRAKNLPFGERFGASGLQSSRRFTTHEDEPGSAIYMQARMYLPSYGKFASPDPAHAQSKGDPESWNLYTYVRNNPVTDFDPTGLWKVVPQYNAPDNSPNSIGGGSDLSSLGSVGPTLDTEGCAQWVSQPNQGGIFGVSLLGGSLGQLSLTANSGSDTICGMPCADSAQSNQNQNWWDIASNAIANKGSVKAAAFELTGRRYSGEMKDVSLMEAEHYLFYRTTVEDNRLWAPVFAVCIPLWDAVKVPGYQLGWVDTPPTLKELNSGYKGIFDALTGGGIQ